MRVFIISLTIILINNQNVVITEQLNDSNEKATNGHGEDGKEGENEKIIEFVEQNENKILEETTKNVEVINKTLEDEKAHLEILKRYALSSSFDRVAAERLFVDKSYLLKELFKTKKKVVLFTRPPKWGKSITLDMIKSFLNIEVDEMGNKLEREFLKQPRMFHGSNLGNDLGYKKLRVSGSVVCKKMCEYPVIHLDLAGIDGFNESQISWAVYDKIDEVFQRQFPYLNETSFLYHLSDDNALKLRYNRFSVRGTVEYGEYKKSLSFLSSLLFKIYRSDVVVLIDNYDKSLLDLYLKYGPNHEASVTLRKCLSDLLKKTLKHNPRLRKAVITGVFPCAKYDLLSKIDLLDCNIFNNNYGQSFGLNDYEIYSLLNKFPGKKIDEIMSFYQGYSHGNRTNLANPYSIMNVYLNNGKIKPYWADKGDIKVFNKALKTYYKHDYKKLMAGKSLHNMYLSQKLDLGEIIQPENLLEMLVYNGYLNAIPNEYKEVPLNIPKEGDNKNVTYTTITFHNVSVPNKEILHSFHRVIRREKLKKSIPGENEKKE